MKNLIKALQQEAEKNRNTFLKDLRKEKDLQTILGKWYYRDLMPKGSKKVFADVKELKAYLIGRYDKQRGARMDKQIQRIETIKNAKDFDKIVINVEYKRSRMWGYNPNAEARVSFADGMCEYFNSGSIGGCGYDKQSTAVANCLNQVNGLLKALYIKRDKQMKKELRETFGYGSGYGILPRIEGGVGVSCYNRIMENIGYTFQTLSSGKSFDVFVIEKKQ